MIRNPQYKNLEELIAAGQAVQKRKVDYSKCSYDKYLNEEKDTFGCKNHGDYPQFWKPHLQGNGCRKCSNETNGGGKKTTESFIAEYTAKFPEHTLDFTGVVYDGAHKKIQPKCILEGHITFPIAPHELLGGQGCCHNCRSTAISQSKIKGNEDFINQAIEIHGDIFDYSLITEAITHRKKQYIPLKCKAKGHEFTRLAQAHLAKRATDCPDCWKERRHEINPFNNPEVQREIREVKFINQDDSEYVTRSKIEKQFYTFLCHILGGKEYVKHSYSIRPYKKDNIEGNDYLKQWSIDIRIIGQFEVFIQVDGTHWHGLQKEEKYYKEKFPGIYETYLEDKIQNEWFKANGKTLYRITDADVRNMIKYNTITPELKNILDVLGITINTSKRIVLTPIDEKESDYTIEIIDKVRKNAKKIKNGY